MKPLIYENFWPSYGATDLIEEPYTKCVVNLLSDLEKKTNPKTFVDYLLGIFQLYIDGLCETYLHPHFWIESGEILNQLLLNGRDAVGSFYRGHGVDFEKVNEDFLHFSDQIISFSLNGRASFKDLDGQIDSVLYFGCKLGGFFSEIEVDTIVCIASGGLEPSLLAMDVLEKEDLFVLRCSRQKEHGRVQIPQNITVESLDFNIRDKSILVIDDYIKTGRTIKETLNFLVSYGPKNLYCGIVKSDGFSKSDFTFEVENILEPRPHSGPCFFKYLL